MDKILKNLRPNLKESSRKSYVINIKKIHDLIDIRTPIEEILWISDNYILILQEIDKIPNKNRQKNYLNTVIVFSGDKEKIEFTDFYKAFSDKRDEIKNFFNTEDSLNEKNEKMKENWVTVEEIDNLIEKYEKDLVKVIKKTPKKIELNELEQLQDYVLLYINSKIPSRNTFAILRKVTQTNWLRKSKESKCNFNWVVTSPKNLEIYLYNHKNQKCKDDFIKIQGMTSKFIEVLKMFISKVPNREYIFHNKKDLPLTSNDLTLLLNRIFKKEFNKKVGTSMLRHIVLTESLSNDLEKRKQLSNDFGHSISQQKSYIKN